MNGNIQFITFMIVSLGVFVLILKTTLRKRETLPDWVHLIITAAVVVIGGMLFARLGQHAGFPWWIYYTVPMLLTVLGPPLVFRMSRRESVFYLILAFMSSPIIHILFSFLLGWNQYMPFIHVPAFREL